MKKIVYIGLCLGLIVCADENPFAIDKNLQKIDKEEKVLLSNFKKINRATFLKKNKKIAKIKVEEKAEDTNLSQKVLEKVESKKREDPKKLEEKREKAMRVAKERAEAIRIKKLAQEKREKAKEIEERQKQDMEKEYLDAIKEVDR